ncbi:MAG: hypothetical protein PHQ91_05130 [Thermoanaerobaculaceae bacterium]|nr:hypothetical protein [Thermoanaerobaculaceae bacterium]TAM51794.1 MAG: hypothetical protein EPN53_06415 [Acidobacteriota bacterium]
MTRKLFGFSVLGAVAGLSLVCDAAVWATTAPAPEIRQVGATAVVYKGPQVDVALSYRFAKQNPTGRWLLLDTAMTAATQPIELSRTLIALRTPDGAVVPLATQQEFGNDYPQLAGTIARANATREPMSYLTPHRFRRIGYFAERGHGLSFPSTWLDQWHNNFGRLFFLLPDGVQKGSYELLIDLPKGRVAIPFTI